MAPILDQTPVFTRIESPFEFITQRRRQSTTIQRYGLTASLSRLALLVVITLLVNASGQAADPAPLGPKTPATDATADLKSQLIGSWRIVSASFDGKPSELHKTSITLKHITPVHVIWIGYQPNDRRIFRSAGGSWKIEDGKYVETMLYGLDEKFKDSTFGKSFAFDCRFEKDRWVQSGKLPNGVFLEEIWERVRENQDVDQRPDGQQPK